MKTLTRINRVVIGDNYHMTTTNENVNWMTVTHLLSFLFFPLNLRTPLLYIYLYFNILIAFIKKNNTTPLCILCTLMPLLHSR